MKPVMTFRSFPAHLFDILETQEYAEWLQVRGVYRRGLPLGERWWFVGGFPAEEGLGGRRVVDWGRLCIESWTKDAATARCIFQTLFTNRQPGRVLAWHHVERVGE